ncbi:hypothetical protein ACKGJN_11315 [Gillisia sp. Q332]|uniref:hypothetical protein n=1 Tax=Gillisia xinjiangensis TaxID=3384765 RepID=UPI00391D955F
METEAATVLIQLALRIIGAVVCTQRAEKLNRSQTGWGIFGFIFPIIAMIAVYFMKPKMVWEDRSEEGA